MAVLLAAGTGAQAYAVPTPEQLELLRAERARVAAAIDLDRKAKLAEWATLDLREPARLVGALEARRRSAGVVLQARRQTVVAALAASSLAPRDVRVKLLLAELIRSAAAAAERAAQADAELASAIRLQGAAETTGAQAETIRAKAEEALADAGACWRSALREWIAGLARPAMTRRDQKPAITLAAVNRDELGRVARPALLQGPSSAVHKRAFDPDRALNPELLRRQPLQARAKRLLAAPPVLASRNLLPISGAVTAESMNSRMGGPPGIAIVTRVTQIVSAPVSGRVAYAAPFQDLGPLLIIDRGGGYHAVLVGVTRLDVREGARVVAGQSLGEIDARWNWPASLHVELRHRGVPIDPAAWFGAHQDKVAS